MFLQIVCEFFASAIFKSIIEVVDDSFQGEKVNIDFDVEIRYFANCWHFSNGRGLHPCGVPDQTSLLRM